MGVSVLNIGELGYDGPLYDRFLHMTDDMLGPSPMHIKYSSYVYDRFCIRQTNLPGPIESVISKFTCISEERTCFFVSNFSVLCLFLILVYQGMNING